MNAIPRFRPCIGVLLAVLAAGPLLAGAQGDPAHAPRQAKQALDDRPDPHAPLDNVGKGTHFARKPLGEGVYFDDRNRAAVRKYYASLADKSCPGGKGEPCLPTQAKQPWRIGQPLPPGAVAEAVPKAIRQSLPNLPPGLQYVQVGGDILLVANASKMVVDGIDGAVRR